MHETCREAVCGRTLWQKRESHSYLSTLEQLQGKSEDIADMLKIRRVKIACVQETKWKGNTAIFFLEGCTI